jgi:hypothetical protein
MVDERIVKFPWLQSGEFYFFSSSIFPIKEGNAAGVFKTFFAKGFICLCRAVAKVGFYSPENLRDIRSNSKAMPGIGIC